jgi:hypothetical protein
MTASVLPQAKQQFFTTAGVPAVGYKIATFDAGTTNPRTTWSDAGQTTPNSNPIILDARGEAVIFWSGAYKVQLQDTTGAVIWTVDNVNSPFAALTQSIIPGTDNTFDLGSTTFAWRQIYVGASHTAILDTTTGNVAYYARTAAEIAAAVTPTNFTYDPGIFERYGAVGNGVTVDYTAINNALLQSAQTGGVPARRGGKKTYNLGANTLVIPANGSLDISGATLVTTNAAIITFGANAILYGYDNAVLTTSGGAGIALALTTPAVPVAFKILGWPYLSPAVIPSPATVGSIGLDFTGAYKGVFEVNIEGYETLVSGGSAATTPQTYFNEFRSPRLRATNGITAMKLRNGCNSTVILNPQISGGTASICTRGVHADAAASFTMIGGYIEALRVDVTTRAVLLNDVINCAIFGTVFDQSADVTGNFAIGATGTSTQVNLYGCGFAGAWGDATRIMSWTASGVYSFIGGAPTNQIMLVGLSTFTGSYASGELRIGKITGTGQPTFAGSAAADYLGRIRNTGDGQGALIENNSANLSAGRSVVSLNRVGGPGYVLDFENNGAAAGGIVFCTGTPEAQITAVVGSIACRTNGGAVTSIYIKESGAGNVGWVAK